MAESNFKQYASEVINGEDTSFDNKVKARIIPVILAPYDEVTKSELVTIKEEFLKKGYSLHMIEDINTVKDFNGEYDMKFIRFLLLDGKEKIFLIPMFYFPRADRKFNPGIYSELIDLLRFERLIFKTGIFYYESSVLINQKRIIPKHQRFQLIDDYITPFLDFVDSYYPIVARNLLLESIGT